MEKFGFIIHPLVAKDIERKLPFAKMFSESMIERVIKHLPPFKVSHITGVESITGSKAEGWFVTCPLTSKQILELPTHEVVDKITVAATKAKELGAEIVGLGAFTSVVGDKGITVANKLDIGITTGNSYTVATALEGTKLASEMMGVDMKSSNILIIGATGSIGKACTKFLARSNKYLILAARNKKKLDDFAGEIKASYNIDVEVGTNINKLLPEADIVIAVSSSIEGIIDIDKLKSGAIVCDIARPRDVSKELAAKRKDILVIDGGIVDVPGNVDFNLDFGFPKGTAYACMAETMILALEKRYYDYSLGSDLELNKIIEIDRLAKKHGFKLASLRSLEKEISLQQLSRVRRVVNSS
ncbi:saccharopine dehydrogenase NADP-binding domain-containing protein [Halonatronum saccharophilum]|uniref:saccharopine dehydrogenase NADP-binding domain-containing protein n=1 Tax=Halonatronum saccharophilum TaxID=150060 RepID=UPI0004887655|nr:saccharopine dehydrogenase NADP-binding domain-containing protein [Halonatronum saccharophilum]